MFMPFARRGQRRSKRGLRQRGQSFVEFALILPVLMLIVLIGLDFARAFVGWIAVNNAARVGANFAATNPSAWNAGNPNATLQAHYAAMV